MHKKMRINKINNLNINLRNIETYKQILAFISVNV